MSKDTLIKNFTGDFQVASIKANDEKLLQQLYHANFFKTEKFVVDNNGSNEDAKDVFQEAFIITWRNIRLDKFMPQTKNSFEAYLFQVAKNKWLDHLRSVNYKKTILVTEEHFSEMPIEEMADKDKQYLEAVKNNFKQLGDNCRNVLTRFYYRKQSLKMIASALGWTEATARNNKYRCIERLRALINNNNK